MRLTVEEAAAATGSSDLTLLDEYCADTFVQCERRFVGASGPAANVGSIRISSFSSEDLARFMDSSAGPASQYQLTELSTEVLAPNEKATYFFQPISGWNALWAQRGGEGLAVEAICWGRDVPQQRLLACAQGALDTQFTKLVGRSHPIDLPRPVQSVAARLDGTNVIITWTAPDFDGGAPITNYTVTGADGVVCDVPAGGGEGSCIVTGVKPGRSNAFQVVARNAAGEAPASPFAVAERLVTPPQSPSRVSVRPNRDGVKVSWARPREDGGEPIDSFIVRARPSNRTCTSTSTSCTISGLASGGTYRFEVRALTKAGTSRPARSKAIRLPEPRPTTPATPTPPAPDLDKPLQELS